MCTGTPRVSTGRHPNDLRCFLHRAVYLVRTGIIKAHRIALEPTKRQDTLFREHCGWARVASDWSRDRFAEAWFTGEGEDNE